PAPILSSAPSSGLPLVLLPPALAALKPEGTPADRASAGVSFVSNDVAALAPAEAPRIVAPDDAPAAPLLGDVLLERGYVTSSQIREALARQSSELTYEALRWQDGTFELRRPSRGSVAPYASLGLPVAHMVMEGFRRVDEWRLIEGKVDNFDAVLQPDAVALSALDDGALTRHESWRL
ncbi:MAG: DUF4388 domain-containing protein, partial [Alphaproteobacteria bacterium]